MQAWWWRSVAACSVVLVVSGVVTAVVAAAEADRTVSNASTSSASSARPGPPIPRTAPPVPPSPSAAPVAAPPRTGPLADRPRVTEPGTGSSVAVPDGWRAVPTQELVPVPPERFGVTLVLGDDADPRALVMLGALDPGLGPEPTPEALGAEARRLVGAFADGTAPDAEQVVLSDVPEPLAGRSAWTALTLTEGGGERTDGALVRVSTVAPVPGSTPGLVLLALALPGPEQDAQARTADDVVRSLEPVSPDPARPTGP